MHEFHLSPEAEAELDDIWLHVARESRSIDTATRVVESITERFWLLARYPYTGRQRDDLRSGLRSFPSDDYLIIYRIEEGDIVLVLHVVHGSRDVEELLRPSRLRVAYLPIQNVEKIRFRISSAVVAPLMPSSGRNAA